MNQVKSLKQLSYGGLAAAVLLIIWLVKRSRKGKAEARHLLADLQDDAAADETNEENE